MYDYHATLNRVIDGDTIDVKIDLGFKTFLDVRLRLNDVNTYELNSTNARLRSLAALEKTHAETLLSKSPGLIIKTYKTGKYGRWIADVLLEDGKTLNEQMREYHKLIANYNL
jgi:micrococcal nuclease